MGLMMETKFFMHHFLKLFLMLFLASSCSLDEESGTMTAASTSSGEEADCASLYDTATSVISNAPLGQGNERKLITKLDNAWRKYRMGKKNSVKNALAQLDVALQLLDERATKGIPADIRTDVVQAISSLRICLAGAPVDLATLTVRASVPGTDGTTVSAGAGVILLVNGVEVGTTGSDGTATIQVPAGTNELDAKLYPSNAGSTEVTLAPGEHAEVDILLIGGKEIAEDTDLVLDESPDGVLDQAFTTFTLRLLDRNGATVALEHLAEVALLHPRGGQSTSLDHLFTLQPGGQISAVDVNAVRTLLLWRSGAQEVRVRGTDGGGRIHDSTVRFYIGRFQVTGTLLAPPSNPSLNVAGIQVTGEVLNTGLVFYTISDENGHFELPILPRGNLVLRSETFQNEKYYYGNGTVVLNRNLVLSLPMLHTDDLAVGATNVPKLEPLSEPGTEALSEQNSTEAEERARRDASSEVILPESLIAPSAPAQQTVMAVAGRVGEEVANVIQFHVPQGTEQVSFKYVAGTLEYPYYVLAQSEYNDTWSIRLNAGANGKALLPPLVRQINSQLSNAPVWQSTGNTGLIEHTLDVADLAADADTTITLRVSAMNVGDSWLPTWVWASLGGPEELRIVSMTPEQPKPLPGTTGVKPALEPGHFSIPRAGQGNVHEAIFTLSLTRPSELEITGVQVDLLTAGGNEMMTILDEGLGENVREIDTETLAVRVSMHTVASLVSSQPPPTNGIKYRFTVSGTTTDGLEMTDTKENGEVHALWRMPDGFGRYSGRDDGGDDWCARGTYLWMDANRSLLKRINDISGEHALNILHKTHRRGTDIDMFHFHTFPDGGDWGGLNYAKLKENVRLAVQTDDPDPTIQAQATAAKARVTDWVEETRAGIDNLAVLSTVAEIDYIHGEEVEEGGTVILPLGWAQNLLENGSTTVAGESLDLGVGAWTNAKYDPDTTQGHNDHVHLDLDDSRL